MEEEPREARKRCKISPWFNGNTHATQETEKIINTFKMGKNFSE